MQRVWYWIKRGAIFLVLWLVVSGLVAGGLFALICYTAGAELPTWLEKEGGTATNLFAGLWALALEAFVLTYLLKDVLCRRFHLTRRQKYWAISGLYVFFYVAIPALYTAWEYCLGID